MSGQVGVILSPVCCAQMLCKGAPPTVDMGALIHAMYQVRAIGDVQVVRGGHVCGGGRGFEPCVSCAHVV